MEEKEPTLGCAIIVGPDRLEELKRLLPQLSKLDQVVVVNTSHQGAITNYVKRLKRPYEVYQDDFRPTPIDANGNEYGLNDWGFAQPETSHSKSLRQTMPFGLIPTTP